MGCFFDLKKNLKKSINLNQYKTTKFLRKTRNINANKFNSFQRKSINTLNYALMGPMMSVIHGSSIRHHNKSYGFENNNKYRQKPKIQKKSARRNCLRHLNHKLFSENFPCDPLNVCSKQMRTLSIMIKLQDFKQNQNNEKIQKF